MLVVDRLAKDYDGQPAVRGVSFSIRTGEVFGLLGPNGAGKTTTIGMIAGVVRPSAGDVRVAGQSLVHNPGSAWAGLGLVPQKVCLYPSLTAEENLEFFGRLHGVEGVRLASRVEELLELTGLTARRRHPVRTFSGGMGRRLNLACGMVHEPALLLLDEPTVGVDPQSRENIFAAVERLVSEGMAVLYTTHYMEEAERLCSRVAILDEGRLVAEGTTSELVELVGSERAVVVSFKNPPSGPLATALRERGAQPAGDRRYQIVGEPIEELVEHIVDAAVSEGNGIAELSVHRANLGEVFLHLTGKDLRDR